jgi:putative transposase
VKANQAQHAVRRMCRLLDVSPSGFYAYVGRAPSKRAVSNRKLLDRIRRHHAASDGTYGAVRIVEDLLEEQPKDRVGRHRVARLMRRDGLIGVTRRRGRKTTKRGAVEHHASDLVDRNFDVDGPDQLWVADITYVPTWAGFLYLSVVLDAWSRRIVGWSMETTLATEGVLAALNMAVAQRKPQNVIHHSDHGCQYTSLAFGRRCREVDVRPSRGSVGDAYDNAMCESFFASLECELIDRRRFRTQAEARMAVFNYIEGFYNPRRRHSALDYLSPINYEQRAQLAASA